MGPTLVQRGVGWGRLAGAPPLSSFLGTEDWKSGEGVGMFVSSFVVYLEQWQFCLPGDIWRCLETLLVVTSGGEVVGALSSTSCFAQDAPVTESDPPEGQPCWGQRALIWCHGFSSFSSVPVRHLLLEPYVSSLTRQRQPHVPI